MKKIMTLLLAVMLAVNTYVFDAKAAPTWPDSVGIQADGGIVMDASTGAVLYGQNIHVQYFPASITKVMTALLVLENCNLDDMVTFSYDAVFNVESGSSNAGLDVGDQLSVKDCLYAMMLRSANEAANALAEHISGSVEEFAKLMNERAKELGCRNTNFMNPNGLNNPEHLTTAYDMALITRAAIQNETFVQIASTTSYKLPVTIRNTEGLTLTPGHKMLYPDTDLYYPGIICGKTGYTSLAGNTLVTSVKKDDMTLITVVLNGHKTHYEDTKALLDFGFANFKDVKIADNENRYQQFEQEISDAGVKLDTQPPLAWDNSGMITLPKDAEFTDAQAAVTYDLSAQDGADTAAKLQYTYGDRNIGAAYLKPGATGPAVTAVNAPASVEETTAESTAAPKDKKSDAEKEGKSSPVAAIVLILFILAAVAGGGVALKMYRDKKEAEERLRRRRRRMERLQQEGVSEREFEEMLAKRKAVHQGNAGNRPSSRSADGNSKKRG